MTAHEAFASVIKDAKGVLSLVRHSVTAEAYLGLCWIAVMTAGSFNRLVTSGVLAAIWGLAASSAKYLLSRKATARGGLASSALMPGAKLVACKPNKQMYVEIL